MPAKAGIQQILKKAWIPACAGMTSQRDAIQTETTTL